MYLIVLSQMFIFLILEQSGKDVPRLHSSAEQTERMTIFSNYQRSDVTGSAISTRGSIPVLQMKRNLHVTSQRHSEILNLSERRLCEHSMSSLHVWTDDSSRTFCDLEDDSLNSI
jgi:hypothetical protein